MKISVLVPSDEYRKQAGARIRYGRIETHFRTLGHELTIYSIDDFTNQKSFVDDVFIISKVHDVRALLAADMARAAGKKVGIDLFDDYYSQTENPRLARMRLWLSKLKSKLDFLLCSTPEMRDLGNRLAPGVEGHVMNDPAPPLDMDFLREALERKLALVHETGKLHLLWFGVGDNPHFSVGLSDLVGWAPELARLDSRGFDITLNVLTNQRALTNENLAMLRQLPVATRVEEWSEARESELLAECFACFLPVNAQNFSIVKSLNRAVTALCSGTQILSAGYPLYAPLKDFVYRDANQLVGDLVAGQPLLSGETVSALSDLMARWADAEQEASDFAAFLGGLAPTSPSPRPVFTGVIHGLNSPGYAHKFAQRAKAFSVASPFCRAKLNFDVKFEFGKRGKNLRVLISENRLTLLAPEIREQTTQYGEVVATMMHALDLEALGLAKLADIPKELAGAPLASALLYGEVTETIKVILGQLFPGIACYISEMGALPVDTETTLSREEA